MDLHQPLPWPDARTLLARAYADDPLIGWLFPDPEHRPSAAAAWLGVYLEQLVTAGGRVDVQRVDGVAGLAAWRAAEPAAPHGTLPTLGGLLAALVGTRRSRELGTALAELDSLRPGGPHLYLQFLAVDPSIQGQGHGRALLERGLARATDSGLAVALETAAPANLPFYAAAGFEVEGTLTLAGGPQVWALRRPATIVR